MIEKQDLIDQFSYLHILQNRIWVSDHLGSRFFSTVLKEDISFVTNLAQSLNVPYSNDDYPFIKIKQVEYYQNKIIAVLYTGGAEQIKIWDVSTHSLLWSIEGRTSILKYTPSPYGLFFITTYGSFVIVVPWDQITLKKGESFHQLYFPLEYDTLDFFSKDNVEIPWQKTSLYKHLPLNRYRLPGDHHISKLYWYNERLFVFNDQGDIFRIVQEFTIEKVIHIGRTTLSPLLFEGPYVVYIDDYNEVAVFDLQTEKFIQKYQPHKTAIKGRYLSRGILVTAARDDPQIKFTDILTGECIFEYQVNEKELPVRDKVIKSLCWNGTTLYGMIYTYLVKWDLPPEVAELKGQGFKEEYDNK